MEILITVLGLGFFGLVGMIVKLSLDETKQNKSTEDIKARRISDLESEISRKDVEMKKMMEERQKLEEGYFKSKDELDIIKKDHSELGLKFKPLEKLKEDTELIKETLKQKEALAQQEIINRQKIQGELSLKEAELEKIKKELEDTKKELTLKAEAGTGTEKLKEELKSKTQMFEGLKGQFSEMEAELQKTKEELFRRDEALKKAVSSSQVIEPKKEEPAKNEKGGQEIPGFSSYAETKVDIKSGVPKDTDFLSAQPSKKDTDNEDIAFKFTNINRPSSTGGREDRKEEDVVAPPAEQEKKDEQAPNTALPLKSEPPAAGVKEKDKTKLKKETLIDGFHPKTKEIGQ